MSVTAQQFLSDATRRTAEELKKAVLELPEDKRGWSPLDKARSANDQVAECAIINHTAAEIFRTLTWPPMDMEKFMQDKAALAQRGAEALSMLVTAAGEAADAMAAVPDDALQTEITGPFGPMKVLNIMSYLYWNMSYHQGQVTYIGSLNE